MGGGNKTTPFLVSGRKPRFYDVAMYDSIILAATAIDACLKAGCHPVGHGYEEVMPYFRAATIDGVSGRTMIKAGSNDPEGRLFSVQVGKNPASRGINGAYTFNEVMVTSSLVPHLQVCVGNIGELCTYRAAAPETVKCFASSATTIDVEWKAATAQGEGLLTGYRVTAFALQAEDQIIAVVDNTADTRVTFALGAANANLRLTENIVYSVQVEALYAQGTITSKAAICIVPQDGLPCVPPATAKDEDTVVRGRLSSGGGAGNCPCYSSSQVYDIMNAASYINGDGHLTSKDVPRPLWPAARNGPPGAFYGGDSCINHDEKLPTTCADDTGNPLADAPSWCSSAWCWVNPDNCARQKTLSAYFPSPKLTYSFATCGGTDTYSATCQCRQDEYHTQGMPPAVDNPPLQPDGSVGGPARDWSCEACLEGAKCMGAGPSSMRTKPGWFVVRSVSNKTGAEKRPKLRRCPGGVASCPGGTSITEVMGEKLPTVKTAARACESITNTTPGMSERGFKSVRLLQYPQCQCGEGGTGMMCRACKSAAFIGGKDWVASGSGVSCRECSIPSAGATKLVAAITFGFLLFVLSIVIVKWHYTKPSVVEERFIDAFQRINELGAKRVVADFFGAEIGTGITQEVFVAAVIRRCGGTSSKEGGSSDAVATSVKTNALKLWDKLDEDGDGQVTLEEFVTFIFDLRDGKKGSVDSKYGKACLSFLGSALEWWRSMKVQTLRAVIITHFQLTSSIPARYGLFLSKLCVLD